MPHLDRITRDPDICHGLPVLRRRAYPVDLLLDLLAAGISAAEILADHPTLEPEDIAAALEYAALPPTDHRRGAIPPVHHTGMHLAGFHTRRHHSDIRDQSAEAVG
ncbi:DUF433 domain-containing protein [Nocardia yamanashiensis]|uniref:DUF433 domain-containing protein n=1 Tax=Nocardia yamanashiensis TaxID=209247 RepID=UPI001E4B48C3|nr:DUF433 domain-containing protein [Nocardia yamanashiensis]UGT40040.1 DUF433 domain-containing protein [Nocardia yamanashiensis]